MTWGGWRRRWRGVWGRRGHVGETPSDVGVAGAGAGWPTATTPVLVVVVNNAIDLSRARDEGWYRLPVAHAPAQIGCEALALYQTGVFGDAGRQVRWWARVLRVGLGQRRELIPSEITHPRAETLYYCFSLGPLRSLPRAVPGRRWRRVTFIPTTWGQLLAAEDVTQLWRRDDPRVGLAQALAQGEYAKVDICDA